MAEWQEIPAALLRVTAGALYAAGDSSLTAMFANDERQLNGSFAIYCIFQNTNGFQVIKARIDAAQRQEFPSLTPVIPAAGWYEREIYDLFGLRPEGHPDLRPLVLHQNWPRGVYPLRRDYKASGTEPICEEAYQMDKVQGEGVFEVPVGPIHAGIIEPGHFRFSQEGEKVLHLDARLFFTHRGIEKAAEGKTFDQVLFQAERICGACSISHTLSFCQAVETMAGTELEPRAEYSRVLLAEMERLYNHIGDIGNLCAGVGFAPGISHGARLKESLMRWNERLTGNRFLRGVIVPGGVCYDFLDDVLQELIYFLKHLEEDFKELLLLLKNNDAFLDRVNTTGVLPKQAAVELAVVGVAARASGIDADVRRDHPYSIYNKLDFKVPVQQSGDVAARLWVRGEEVFQTISLLRQIIGTMPEQQGQLRKNILSVKPYTSSLGWSESPRGSNFHWIMAGENNTIYRYFIRSASYANWPAVPVTVPGNIIPDFPLINKSFELCYACIDR